MNRRSYLTAGRLPELRDQLSPLDQSLLHEIDTMRLAQTTQLQRLHGIEGLSAVRSFRRRLSQLTEWQVLTRLERTVGGSRGGSASFIYRIGPAGQRLLGAESGQRVRPAWTPRPSWLNHALLVSELYVQLRLAQEAGELALSVFETEPACWRPFAAGYGGSVVLKPDAFSLLGIDQEDQFNFYEVDQGTESPSTLSRKLDVYRNYWLSSSEQSANGGVFPQVVWLVPDERRLSVLTQVVKRQPRDSWPLHVVAKYSDCLTTLMEPP